MSRASPFSSCDGDVDLTDAVVLMSKGGTTDPTGDLDGDGGVSGT